MLRKILVPVFYFIFGILVFYLESTFISSVVDSLGITTGDVNKFNMILFIVISLLLIIFEVIPQTIKTTNRTDKFVYVILSVAAISLTTFYWVTFLVWK